MTSPTIRLATDDDMRAITSRNLDEIHSLPYVYIPTPDGEVMRCWGVALAGNVADNARLYPGALVAPKRFEDRVDRGELLYNGAEPADWFVPRA